MVLNTIMHCNANSQRNYSGAVFYIATFHSLSQIGELDQDRKNSFDLHMTKDINDSHAPQCKLK